MGGQGMNHDMDMCDAMVDNGYCPLRENCKRWVMGQKALMENHPRIYWIYPCYKDGKCELQIKINDEQENQKNG